ncbi:unnamed protein product [Cochlearia groenlandica]
MNLVKSKRDFTGDLPDECLAHIYITFPELQIVNASLLSVNGGCSSTVRIVTGYLWTVRKRSSLSLTLYSIDSVTKLTLRCDPLKKLSIGSCSFGAKGVNVILKHCDLLEELTAKRLRGIHEAAESIQPPPDSDGSSLRSVCLKELVNGGSIRNIDVNATHVSLSAIASNCEKLERLALCWSGTIGDAEIVCIAKKCGALRKLCVKGCAVSDLGIEALAVGCPNLVKLKVKKCRLVTREIGEWLREQRKTLMVNMDIVETETSTVVDREVVAVAEEPAWVARAVTDTGLGPLGNGAFGF